MRRNKLNLGEDESIKFLGPCSAVVVVLVVVLWHVGKPHQELLLRSEGREGSSPDAVRKSSGVIDKLLMSDYGIGQ